jgi:general nucleoside transport system ATP-binding protein
MTEPHALAVEAVGIGKRFGSVQALEDVSLKVEAGEFHALLGENGAGKSTLVKCLVGFHPPDDGSFLVDGREHAIDSPREAQRLHIGMVYQHFTLAPGMTVAENLLLPRGDLPARIRWKKELAGLEAFMAAMPFHLPLRARVSDLAAGEKQKLEILKQLYLGQRLLILDEPTSVLTPGEADEVLGLLHAMTRRRELTVIMITHKFREVLAYADSVSILRRGRFVGGGRVGELGAGAMAAMMMGDSGPAPEVPMAPGAAAFGHAATDEAEPFLAVRSLDVDNDRGMPAVRELSLMVRPGELVGIAGVAGNGQRELVETLLGQRTARSGSIEVAGTPYRGTRADIRRHQVFSLPEEPLRNACVPGMSVAENMALRNFDVAPVRRGWRLDRRALRARARALIADFNVRPPNPEAAIENLSGGNVQRAVLARELSEPVKLLIVANPVFGLDFAATAGIHQRLLAARDGGAAVLLISEDLDEIIELSDRILVMSEGRIVFETTPAASPAEIGRHMAGHTSREP